MIINTNVSSLSTRNYLRKNNDDLQMAMERLSSGKRINKAADDAAGLSIATRMTSQVRGMDVATRNAGDGISLIQTAESAMGSIGDILQRMRELAVQADNGTYSDSDKVSIKAEMDALVNEIEHIADTTKFNGISLLNAAQTLSLHMSDLANDTMDFALFDMQTAALSHGDGATTISLSSIDVTATVGTLNIGGLSANGAQDAIHVIDGVLDLVSSYRSNLGAVQNRLGFAIDNLSVARQNTTASRSRIEDADMAEETSKMTRNKILNQSSIAMLAQANQNPNQILQLLQP